MLVVMPNEIPHMLQQEPMIPEKTVDLHDPALPILF
jgi:hypothetical protein